MVLRTLYLQTFPVKNSVRTFGPSKLVREMTRKYLIGLYNILKADLLLQFYLSPILMIL